MTAPPYVALYGSHGGTWRQRCARLLDAEGIAWHDPTDPRWRGLDHGNGDEHQALIDELVAAEHRALLGAACAVFHLAAEDDAGRRRENRAARLELGLAAGRGVPSFVHVDPRLRGRNYLWAALLPYPHMVRCAGLEEACRRAAALVRART